MGTSSSFGPARLRAAALTGMLLAGIAVVGAVPATADHDDDDLTCYAVNQRDELLRFECDDRGRIRERTAIGGLGPSEDVVGIDFRISDFALYALIRDAGTATGRIATIDLSTGATTTTCTDGPLGGADADSFGVDFNPVVDRLRVVNDTNQNFRFNPGAAGCGRLEDGALAYAAGDRNAGSDPGVTAVGFLNSVRPSPRTSPPALGTTLYDIDVSRHVLAIQNPPNDGTLNSVGRLRTDVRAPSGFDIACQDNTAFAALKRSDERGSRLFEVDLRDGDVDSEGRIGRRNDVVRGLAIDPATCDIDRDDRDRDDDRGGRDRDGDREDDDD
jgi:Domain of unknown function (DUF4394)